VDVDEVVYGRDSVCDYVRAHVDADADVHLDANANAPVYDLVNLHAHVHETVAGCAPCRFLPYVYL
jgi:hypothetical protein